MASQNQSIHGTVARFLTEAAKQLARFLEKELTSRCEDWWNKAVIPSLSFQQVRQITLVLNSGPKS